MPHSGLVAVAFTFKGVWKPRRPGVEDRRLLQGRLDPCPGGSAGLRSGVPHPQGLTVRRQRDCQ